MQTAAKHTVDMPSSTQRVYEWILKNKDATFSSNGIANTLKEESNFDLSAGHVAASLFRLAKSGIVEVCGKQGRVYIYRFVLDQDIKFKRAHVTSGPRIRRVLSTAHRKLWLLSDFLTPTAETTAEQSSATSSQPLFDFVSESASVPASISFADRLLNMAIEADELRAASAIENIPTEKLLEELRRRNVIAFPKSE